jgi:3-hydroxyisobutyrate dehydrogenase-like beta-hydroxyacid dehydrogenase
MKLGFIGLGDQGGPIARRMIEAGYPVVLWARRPESLTPFSDTRAEIAPSIAELGAQTDHVGICVVDDAGVREVCGALIPAMKPGGRIVIHGTVHPNTCRELEKQAAAKGLFVIDAPVSGGAAAARAGKLTVMVGGDKDAAAAARPVFETFGALILHLGEVGAGQAAKLINNALLAAHMALAHHGLCAADALKLDRRAFVDLIKASSGRSYGFEAYAQLPSQAAFSHGASLLRKDMRLLGEVLGADPSYAPMRDIAEPFLKQAQDRGAKPS